MDPLSLTASIIAILGAGGTISKGLSKIRNLKRAPYIVLQLNNEVTDLHLLIRAVDDLYRRADQSILDAHEHLVYNALERAKHAVLELEELIEYVLTKESDSGKEVNRLGWIRALDRVKEVKNNIHVVRSNLNMVWINLCNRLANAIHISIYNTY